MSSNLDEDFGEYEGRWPLPHGLALHCYLVRGEKSLVVDPYHEGEYGAPEVAEDLEVLGLGWADVTAVVFTGVDPGLSWPVPVVTLAPGQTLVLGGSKVVERTASGLLEVSTGVLFSGALGAGFGAIEDTVLSTEANGPEAQFYEDEALRWWLTHGRPGLSLPAGTRFVAPGHGLLWPNPEALKARLHDWGLWSGPAEDEVTLIWSHDADQDERVFELVAGLQRPSLALNIFRVPADHSSFVQTALWRSSAVVLGPGVDPTLVEGLSKKLWHPSPTEGREAAKSWLADL